jgi:hypothetical protein
MKLKSFCIFAARRHGVEGLREVDGIGVDWMDALFTEGTADYVDDCFFRRRDEVGTVILDQSLPEYLQHHLGNLQETYALGLFEATVVFSRTLIEVGAFECLRRKGKILTHGNVVDIGEYKPNTLIHQVKPFLKKTASFQKIKGVITIANRVLHTKGESVKVTEEGAYAIDCWQLDRNSLT